MTDVHVLFSGIVAFITSVSGIQPMAVMPTMPPTLVNVSPTPRKIMAHDTYLVLRREDLDMTDTELGNTTQVQNEVTSDTAVGEAHRIDKYELIRLDAVELILNTPTAKPPTINNTPLGVKNNPRNVLDDNLRSSWYWLPSASAVLAPGAGTYGVSKDYLPDDTKTPPAPPNSKFVKAFMRLPEGTLSAAFVTDTAMPFLTGDMSTATRRLAVAKQEELRLQASIQVTLTLQPFNPKLQAATFKFKTDRSVTIFVINSGRVPFAPPTSTPTAAALDIDYDRYYDMLVDGSGNSPLPALRTYPLFTPVPLTNAECLRACAECGCGSVGPIVASEVGRKRAANSREVSGSTRGAYAMPMMPFLSGGGVATIDVGGADCGGSNLP